MLSVAVSSTDFVFSIYSLKGLCPWSLCSSVKLSIDVRRRRSWKPHSKVVSLCSTVKEARLSNFSDCFRKGNWFKGSNFRCSHFVRRCKDWESEGVGFDLETEILEFMKTSSDPEAFPTKKELVEAGRLDLVVAVEKKGDWLSFGWDVDEEEERMCGDMGVNDCRFTIDNNGCDDIKDEKRGNQVDELRSAGLVSSFSENGSQSATSMGRSVEKEAKDESGIEGILNRLEKQRNEAFGFRFRQPEGRPLLQTNIDEEKWSCRTLTNELLASKEIPDNLQQKPATSLFDDCGSMNNRIRSGSNVNGLRNSLKSETWRSWSIQRAGFSDEEFEPAEIPLVDTNNGEVGQTSENEMLVIKGFSDEEFEHAEIPSVDTNNGEVRQPSENEMLDIEEFSGKPISNGKESDYLNNKLHGNDIRSCLWHLESELSMLLHPLSPNVGNVMIEKGRENYSDELQKLSDALEFQEIEIMNARDRLRSVHSKLSILEGKMALAIIDAQNMVDKKQKRIDHAHKALQLLRTAYIVWHIAASEVLLAGSYDGWVTQRKMEKSSTEVFSLCIKLYPGRYEIKFIVDGEWKVDPLRPIVHDSGFENNLLIIT